MRDEVALVRFIAERYHVLRGLMAVVLGVAIAAAAPAPGPRLDGPRWCVARLHPRWPGRSHHLLGRYYEDTVRTNHEDVPVKLIQPALVRGAHLRGAREHRATVDAARDGDGDPRDRPRRGAWVPGGQGLALQKTGADHSGSAGVHRPRSARRSRKHRPLGLVTAIDAPAGRRGCGAGRGRSPAAVSCVVRRHSPSRHVRIAPCRGERRVGGRRERARDSGDPYRPHQLSRSGLPLSASIAGLDAAEASTRIQALRNAALIGIEEHGRGPAASSSRGSASKAARLRLTSGQTSGPDRALSEPPALTQPLSRGPEPQPPDQRAPAAPKP